MAEEMPELPGEDRAADERTTLLQALDFYRAVLLRKAWGLDDTEMRARLGPSEMTVGGLLLHMAMVEDNWFPLVFAGRPQAEPWASAPWADDRDWEFHAVADWSGSEIREVFARSVGTSNEVIAAADSLDQRASTPDRAGKEMSLRWIVNHMISEYARHCGHADLIRESIDGVTGD